MTTTKTARKTVSKKPRKVTAKKTVRKTTADTVRVGRPKKTASGKKTLVYADGPHSFWVSDGQILDSLLALRDALDTMEHEVYRYHAMGDTNDFSDWVEKVLYDDTCAQQLQNAKTPRSAKTVIVKNLKLYAL